MDSDVAEGFALRPYQEQAIDRIEIAERRGVRRQLGVAATGLGKTIMFCSLARQRVGRTLILAHRDELVNQAAAKIREVWPDVAVGIVKAERNDVDAQVVVASVQTLSRGSRLDQLTGAGGVFPVEAFGLVVVDEAHHAAAKTYRAILDGLDAGTPGGPLLLGVTATPDRGDGKGLDDLFDEIVFSYDILWGIRAGYLSDIRGLRVQIDALDLSAVKVSRGDYQAGDVGRALDTADAPNVIAESWLRHAAGRRTLVFTPTVETAIHTRDAFESRGVNAGCVFGAMPPDERHDTLHRFSTGALDVLVNCMVLTEGYDEPRVDCIIVARPTKSRALYTQMIGRGTRRHPDKADCLVIDVVGVSEEHSLVTVPSLFGIDPKRFDRMVGAGDLLTRALTEQDDEAIAAGRLKAEEVALFRQVQAQGIAWIVASHPGELTRYVRPLGADGAGVRLPTVVLARRPSDLWTAGLIAPDGTKRVLIGEVDMELAQGVAEDYVRKMASRSALVETDARWRKRRPSDKAKAAATRWKLPDVTKYKTAGDLSDALDAHIVRVQEARRRRETGST